MTISQQSSYDYHEICEELGIPYEAFLEFIRKNDGSEQSDQQPVMITIQEAVKLYLEDLQLRVEIKKRSEETYKTYKSFLQNFGSFIETIYPSINLNQINEVHLNKFLLKTKQRHDEASPYTANTYTGILRNFIKFCFKEGWTASDFRSRFEWNGRVLLPRYIPDDKLDKLLRQSLQMINGYRNHAILSVLVGTGLRISELTRLQIRDIDFNLKVIFVRKGKGNKERPVPLYPEVELIILDFLNITGLKELGLNRDGFIFATDYGTARKKPITKNAIEKMVRRLCKKAGIEETYTPHVLRHTFSVRCLKKGMRIEYLSQILGHTSILTTNVYIQLLPEDLGQVLTEKFPFPLQDLLFRSIGVD